MDNILEQIQSLTDKFNNLFEVEGLGEPSGDVPPSTNKIKKDKKTKDGKVELVSVEDELFPKEGNAKEQFRQKIIDKINGMIQGTATLEDLLQLVRSKQVKPVKEGFEGAIELLEEIINEVSNKTVERALNKSGDKVVLGLMGKIPNDYKNIKQYKELSNLANKRAEKHGEKVEQDPDTGWHKHVKEGFEGAVEILEEIINEVSVGALARATENNFKKRQEAHKKSTENLKKAYDSYEEQSRKHPEDEPALYNAVSKLGSATRKEGEKASHANDLANLNLPKDSKVSANKLFDKADKTYAKRGKEVDKALDKGKGRGDKEFDAPMKKYSRAVDLAVADPVVSRRTNGGANESFEQAISVLEKLISERKYSEEEIREIAKKVRPERVDKFNKACGELDKVTQGRNPNKFSAVQKYRANKAAEKVERAEDRLNHVDDIINPAVKTPIGIKRANESFEQAISQIEDLINCLGESKPAIELSSVAKKVLPQREEEAKRAHASLDSVTHVNPYSMINGKLSQKQRDNIANALSRAERADNKVAKAKAYLEKPKEKQSSGIRFDKILCNLEEAMNVIEATVGKLATSSAKSVEPRRKEYQDLTSKAQKATGADKVMLNAKAQKAQKRYAHALELNTLHLPKDSKVSANKLFKAADKSVEGRKRQDKYKRYTRAWNIADANPVKTNEGLFIEDGRGDLIDDISKCLTKKTVKQHIVDTAKKIIKKKEK